MDGWREANRRKRLCAPAFRFSGSLEELEPRWALATGYLQLNLVSDQAGAALMRDLHLVDPWGLALSPIGGNFWIADHGAGVVTNYGGAVNGTALGRGSLVFSVPGGSPTGQVFNGGVGFDISSGTASGPATLLLAGDGGRISGWNQAVPLPVPSTSGQTAVDDGEAAFTGVTLALNGGQTLLYAADFRHGTVDVFDANFAPVNLAGAFAAPGLPEGFAPYNVANLGGKIYVTYARQDAGGRAAATGGGGAVVVFNPDGQYIKTLTSSSALNAPWGIAVAPANFGDFSGAVLVGNWGDGRIHAFNPANGNLLGTLASPGGGAIMIDGLRGLSFGNGLTAGDANALFFTAGPNGGAHGLFGAIRTAQASNLAAIGVSTNAPLGSALDVVLATFSDSNANLSPGSFTAQINWGDGFNSAGTVVALGGGRFNLVGTHAYTQLGLHSAIVTIQDPAGNLAVASAQVNVKIPLLSVTGANVAATEDAAFSGVLATFTDADGNLSPSAYQAAIDWGDGATTTGAIVGDGAGGFSVTGVHAYADEGPRTIRVVIFDDDGDQVAVDISATVAEADVLSGQARDIAATEGLAFSGAVATFHDVNPLAVANDFVGTIDWGDGATTTGVVSGASGTFTVSGSHVYARYGDYRVRTALVDPAPGTAAATVEATAHVADALLAAIGFTFAAVEAKAFSGAVASFTDANPGAQPGDFTAVIDWGDGTTTSGSISAVGGAFQVAGSHAFSAPSAGLRLSVHIADAGGSAATAQPLAIVANAPIHVTVSPVGGFEDAALANVVVATFIDTGTTLSPASYAAAIDWGDGQTTAGVIAVAGGTLQVRGSHVYADEGRFPLVVTVTDDAGGEGVGRGGAEILEALLWNGTRGTAVDRWINEVYDDLLGRLADAGALGFWGGLVEQGINRNLIVSAIESSDECRGRQIETLFQTYLHRSVDSGARSYFLSQLATGATWEELAATLLGSDEYYHRRAGGSADGFLDALYQDALGRSVDDGARLFFAKQLAAGVPRSRIASVILASDEYRQLLLQDFYLKYLEHNATSGSTSFWLAYMRQGGRDEQVIAAIVGSDEFFQKTAP